MSSFKTRTFDAPIVYRPDPKKKIRKLKDMFESRQKKKKTTMMLWEGGAKPIESIQVLPPNRMTLEEGIKFDPKRLLNNELVDIVDLLATAKQTYRDLPDGENASSLTMILRELRGFIGDLYQMTQEDKGTIYKVIDVEIVQPFIRSLAKGIVTELDSARKQLISSLGEDKIPEVNGAIREAAKNFKPLFSSQYTELMREIAKALDIGQEIRPIIDGLDAIIRNK